MLITSLHTRWIARIFILFYLLLITSTGNSLFWCKDAEASTHLESNLAGTCWFPCLSETAEEFSSASLLSDALTLSSENEDCVDSSAHATFIPRTQQNLLKNKSTRTDVNLANSPFVAATDLNAERSRKPTFSHQLPPRQTLLALRTIVLLH